MNYTYEENNNKCKLETYEWDNIWWDNSNKACEKHILVIGDSISCGYRKLLITASDNKWSVDGVGTSKAIDNPFLKSTIDNAIAQQENYDIILFNNGLHGWHLSSEEYGRYYRGIIEHLKSKRIPMFIVLSTPVRDRNDLSKSGTHCDEVVKRNIEATAVAKEFDIPTIDLYNVLVDRSELFSADAVHLLPEGYDLLAKEIFTNISKMS